MASSKRLDGTSFKDAANWEDVPVKATHPQSGAPTILASLGTLLRSLLFDRRYYWVMAVGVLAFECLATGIIIQKVPYTEIDWKAYMQEVEGYLAGERDYTKLKGDTGPLV
ncbi:dolichyl-P-Man:Man5GlcNAc2-PP-dolichol alpha-1,3-mannosyltransferase [Spizellomyces sp. 'palustris']|nr:dolichyl-P-Man:Man5GlcNAc2-PP-dolichol alpha-1,3-mannosyltransferase [Spizellomyces sp. 'palustris']